VGVPRGPSCIAASSTRRRTASAGCAACGPTTDAVGDPTRMLGYRAIQ
jgi:hypothetical protein